MSAPDQALQGASRMTDDTWCDCLPGKGQQRWNKSADTEQQ